MDNEDSAAESILDGNVVFVSKILSAWPSEQSSRHGYFIDKKIVVPFIWEKEPGIPKNPPTLDFVPPIIPPPSMFGSQHGPKLASTKPRSCFFMKHWLRISKPNKVLMKLKGNQYDDTLESFHWSNIFSEDDLNSSGVSKSSSKSSTIDSPASSKGSSKLLNFIEGIHRWLF